MIVREMPKKISKYFPPKFYGNVGSVTSNIDPISSFYLFSISFEKKSTDFSLQNGSVDNKYFKTFYYSDIPSF